MNKNYKIAVAYDEENIADFKTAKEYKVYTPRDEKSFTCEMVNNPAGKNSVSLFLTTICAGVLICNNIDEESKEDLWDFDVEIVDGVVGKSDMAIALYMRDKLIPGMDISNVAVGCGSHSHSHDGCAGHTHSHVGCGGCGSDASSSGCGGCGSDASSLGCGGCGQ